jgi:hypothetical protein
MDSLTARRATARPAASDEAPAVVGPVSGLARIAPAARGAVRAAWRIAGAGALGATAVWAALAQYDLAAGTFGWAPSLIVAAVLLVPAGAAALLAWTLGDLIDLPGQFREAAENVRLPTREGGVGGLFRTVWALRGLAAGGTQAWARTVGLARLARLPFLLGLLGLVALNAVVVVAGLVALVILAL